MKTNGFLVIVVLAAVLTSSARADEISLQSAPPVVVRTVPVAGATDVDPGLTEIKVTYSKAMEDGSWSWRWWENKDDYPQTTGDPRYLQDSRTCVLPVKLQPNKFYALWLNTEKYKNFKDTSSQPAVPYLLTFFTGEAGNDRWTTVGENVERGPGAIVAKTIRSEVARQLKEAGATYDDLQVTVAEERDSATPFTVSYRGLRNFKYTRGGKPDPGWPASASGQFIMTYNGGGQWRGKLGDTQFTVQVGQTDNIDLPFVNDPQVIGEWESVDFVADKSGFNPDKRKWKGKLYLKDLSFREDGKVSPPWSAWTKGVLLSREDKTASHYEIRKMKGRSYLFLEWKSGDVTIAGMKPHYYVLRKKAGQLNAERERTVSDRKFVRLVVGKDQMNFEGVPVTRDQLEDRLAEVPDRAHTVLELAVTADGPPAMTFLEMKNLASVLVKRLGFEYLSLVGVHPLGSKGEPAKPPPANRKFVELVVGKGKMTFEGEPITRDQLEDRLAEVPDRPHTVLELASTSDGSTVDGPSPKEFFEIEDLAMKLVKRLGFEYLSLVGVHPLGSKAGEPAHAATDSTSGIEAAVKSAVTTTSGCTEGDPRVTKALESLQPLDQSQAVRALASYLNSSQPTIRRAAIYILWKAGFADVSPAVADLEKLLSHDEDLTRGMAALALGQNHVRESFDALAKMAREDQSGYARRCAAYALGLLGDARAKPVLEAALKDSEALVRNNAEAALRMIEAATPSLR